MPPPFAPLASLSMYVSVIAQRLALVAAAIACEVVTVWDLHRVQRDGNSKISNLITAALVRLGMTPTH
jgi:hypothetical protein